MNDPNDFASWSDRFVPRTPDIMHTYVFWLRKSSSQNINHGTKATVPTVAIISISRSPRKTTQGSKFELRN